MSAAFRQQKRRALRAVQDRVDKITEADARFFDRHPHRRHRVRHASAAELEQNALITGVADPRPTPGHRYYVAVRQLAPGIRLRLFAESADDADVDMTEDEARTVFEFVSKAHEGAAEIERKLKATLAKRGRG